MSKYIVKSQEYSANFVLEMATGLMTMREALVARAKKELGAPDYAIADCLVGYRCVSVVVRWVDGDPDAVWI